MADRSSYSATRSERHLYGARRRLTTRRTELIVGVHRWRIHQAIKGQTTPFAPFVPDDDPDDTDAN